MNNDDVFATELTEILRIIQAHKGYRRIFTIVFIIHFSDHNERLISNRIFNDMTFQFWNSTKNKISTLGHMVGKCQLYDVNQKPGFLFLLRI